ncbi:MAG TPA: prepilin peptidase [Geminicoccaceae bacterium]|nr:prepilin peptidase [Geminicoccaceae bacterium]
MTVATLGFGALLVAASCFDVLKLRIPNLIPLALLALFVLEVAFGTGTQAPLGHFLAMVLALVVLLPLFALDMLGGGDVKLLAAVALWLGMTKLAPLMILVGIAGGIFALVWLAIRWLIRTGLPGRELPRSLQARAPVPFALPIMIAAMLLLQKG